MFKTILCVLALVANAKALACDPSVVGRLDIRALDAKVFAYPHGLRIWLPPGYDEVPNAAKTYPVLYLLDGQNLFDRCTSYIGAEWNVDETATRLIAEGRIPPVIVVGLDNAGAKRAEEYFPGDDQFDPDARDNRGQLFPKFLKQDVMPWVSAHYRVAEGPDNTAVGGSSYGGIAALNIATHEPMLASVRVLATNLASAAAAPAVQLQIGTGDHHNERAWSRRLPEALVFLYGTSAGNVATPATSGRGRH